jgi:hypothetical protein
MLIWFSLAAFVVLAQVNDQLAPNFESLPARR